MNSQENADAFYDTTIMPYKGILEEWYVKNDNVYSYFKLVILTILVVVKVNLGLILLNKTNLLQYNSDLTLTDQLFLTITKDLSLL